jgi:LPXTG-site transpeptidase (sortase) family protein
MKTTIKRLRLQLTFDDVIFFGQQLAFGWLLLFYLPEKKANRKPKPLSIALPFRKQNFLTAMLLVIGILGAVYFGFYGQRPVVSSGSLPAPKQDIRTPSNLSSSGLSRSEPVSLRVPSVGISTNLITLGTEPDGTLETPDAYDVAGWYKYSPTPGQIGPSVIVGHVDNYKGPAIFFRLKELKAGDIIEVTRANGAVVKFKVDGVQQFQQDNFPTAQVYGNTKYAGLRLITCGGEFNRATGEYLANTVVFASKTD